MSNYSITPVTKLFRKNGIPASPFRKGKGASTGNYGNVIWYQTKDGYSWSRSQNSPIVSFEVRGREVFDKMVEVLKENDIEIQKEQHNYEYGGFIQLDLNQFQTTDK